jgi:hypothetical protein
LKCCSCAFVCSVGVNASLHKVGAKKGLMVVDQAADWARAGQGGENIAANALLYGVLSGARKQRHSFSMHTFSFLRVLVLSLSW